MTCDTEGAPEEEASPPGLASVVKPLKVREPEMSAGAAQHGTGECRPCAWFWRPQGCNNGGNCRHCHMCPQGELKARRKSKTTSMRKQVRIERAVTAPEQGLFG